MSHATLYITASDREAALRLARLLVESRLAACANVIDGITSIYWWEGKMEEESEAALFAKTRTENIPALTALVKQHHAYSCPCVVAWPIVGGNRDYLDWIDAETKPAA